MDYQEVILKGYCTPNERKYLVEYFLREFRKAEKEYYSPEVFFNGCLDAISQLNNVRLKPYFAQLERWSDYDIQQQKKGLKNELEYPNFEPELSLLNHTGGRYSGSLTIADLEYLQDTVLAVYESLCNGVNSLKIRYYYSFPSGIIKDESGRHDKVTQREHQRFCQIVNDQKFQSEIKSLPPDKMPERLEFHLRSFITNKGDKADWIRHTRALIPANITPEQKDCFLVWLSDHEAELKVISETGAAGIDTNGSELNPRENHHVKALYLVYTGEQPKRQTHGNSVFNKWSLWRIEKNRRTVGPIVGFNTKLKHLKTVRDWLISENNRTAANKCQSDIDKLKENYAKQ